jgi:hypothetical protein
VITAGFVIVTALLLWAVILARGPWQLKLVLILLLPVFAYWVHHELDSYRGYPKQASPPDGAQYIASVIREPEPDDPGAVYVWVMVDDKPRAFQVPYSRVTHRGLADADDMRRRGKEVALQRIPRNLFRPYLLPPIQPPEK